MKNEPKYNYNVTVTQHPDPKTAIDFLSKLVLEQILAQEAETDGDK